MHFSVTYVFFLSRSLLARVIWAMIAAILRCLQFLKLLILKFSQFWPGSSERWSQPSNVCLLQFFSIFSTFAPVIWAMIAAILYLSSSVLLNFSTFQIFSTFALVIWAMIAAIFSTHDSQIRSSKKLFHLNPGHLSNDCHHPELPLSSPTGPGFSQLFSNFTRPMPFYLCPL